MDTFYCGQKLIDFIPFCIKLETKASSCVADAAGEAETNNKDYKSRPKVREIITFSNTIVFLTTFWTH